MPKILLAEDDTELAEMLARSLRFEHYNVEIVANGEDALSHLDQCDYEIAILDWTMPGMSGLDVCKKHRARGGKTPILMLTGKGELDDKTMGLDSGADDYLTKPFHLKELIARLRALLRRGANIVDDKVLTFEKLQLDIDNHKLTYDGHYIKLIPKEFRILEVLMKQPGRVFSAEELLRKVWLANEDASNEAVRTHIKNLRAKLAKNEGSPAIETVH
ncbi:MAG: response regulator transcription factor, partial [Terriglobales bacterium]